MFNRKLKAELAGLKTELDRKKHLIDAYEEHSDEYTLRNAGLSEENRQLRIKLDKLKMLLMEPTD